jgi:hypothetical protein
VDPDGLIPSTVVTGSFMQTVSTQFKVKLEA